MVKPFDVMMEFDNSSVVMMQLDVLMVRIKYPLTSSVLTLQPPRLYRILSLLIIVVLMYSNFVYCWGLSNE